VRDGPGSALFPSPPETLDLKGRKLALDRPLVMGVLNLTPDSFYDGGRLPTTEAAVERAITLAEEGADLLDLGAVSTRPGSLPVSAEEELARLLPSLSAVRRAVDLPLSVDTFRPEVATAAADHGADCLNDVTGLRDSDALARIAASNDLGIVVMHMRGTPATMQRDTQYPDLMDEIRGFLADAVERATAAGVPRSRVVVDPGIGFGKSAHGNLVILRRLGELVALGQPVLVGASRKSFIGKFLDLDVEERLEGSLAAAVAAVLAGAHLLRVHDVRETVRAVRLAALIRDEG
jgi:dihydropteroate synthase